MIINNFTFRIIYDLVLSLIFKKNYNYYLNNRTFVNYLIFKFKHNFIIYLMGIGDWGLGIGDWGLGDRKSVV